jgi:hypothetical protein
MKRILIIAICLIVGNIASAQKIAQSDVPESILKAYKMKMSDTISTSWEKGDKFYTANFTKSNLKASMVFSEAAEWIWTRWEIPVQYLPKKVKDYIITNYAGYKTIKSIIEYKTGGEFYIVTLKKKKVTPVLRFSIKGDFVGVEETKPVTDPKAKNK